MNLPPGVIRADEVYTVSEFRKRSGLGDFAFRKVRQSGLRIVDVGKKRFILGTDWIKYLNEIGKDVAATPSDL